MKAKYRGFAPALLLVIGAVVGVAVVLAVQSFDASSQLTTPTPTPTPPVDSITSFEECEVAPGSTLTETVPAICITSDGKRFTDGSDKTTGSLPASLPSIPILDTTDWTPVSLSGVGFKIPPDFRCEDSNSDCSKVYAPPTVINGSTHTPAIPSRITVVDYEGGSRRVQFAGLYGTQLDLCKPIYQDAYFGSVRALQIAIDSGECQGDDGGAIVAVVGDKLFISWGLIRDYQSGIMRWDIQDSIISTLNQ